MKNSETNPEVNLVYAYVKEDVSSVGRKIKSVVLFTIFLFMCSLFISPLSPLLAVKKKAKTKKTTVEIKITNIKKTEGFIRLRLLSTKESFKDEDMEAGGDLSVVIQVKKKELTFSYDGLEPGKYAIKLFHDVNGNGKLDTNTLGVPKEPYGFSNNARATFGPPDYEDCLFEVKANQTTTTVIKL